MHLCINNVWKSSFKSVKYTNLWQFDNLIWDNWITNFFTFTWQLSFTDNTRRASYLRIEIITFKLQYHDCYPLSVKPELPRAHTITIASWWLCSKFACRYLNIRKRHRYMHHVFVTYLHLITFPCNVYFDRN